MTETYIFQRRRVREDGREELIDFRLPVDENGEVRHTELGELFNEFLDACTFCGHNYQNTPVPR